jgi:hypothetical protein
MKLDIHWKKTAKYQKLNILANTDWISSILKLIGNEDNLHRWTGYTCMLLVSADTLFVYDLAQYYSFLPISPSNLIEI